MSRFARRASAFGKLIEGRRKQLLLSREEFAPLVGLSVDYLADLETRGTKKPRLDKLVTIARVASCRTREQALSSNPAAGKPTWDEVDKQVALEVMLSAMGVDAELFKQMGLIPFAKEIAEQHQEPEGSEIWIISDILAEATDQKTAEETAQNIRAKKIRYRFFVPFSSADVHWRTAVDQIREALGKNAAFVDDFVRVYKLSDCGFSARLRISGIAAPGSVQPTGRYTIFGTRARDARLVDAPPGLVGNVTTLLGTMTRRAATGRYDDSAVGSILRVFPEPESKRPRR